jgi:hypothetical protein
MAEIIALLIGFGVFAAIMGRAQQNSEHAELEWSVRHSLRAPCRYCEHDVYWDSTTTPTVWRHLYNEQVTSKTPHGQPHDAFAWPFSRDLAERVLEEDRALDFADEEDEPDPDDYPVTTRGAGPRPVAH